MPVLPRDKTKIVSWNNLMSLEGELKSPEETPHCNDASMLWGKEQMHYFNFLDRRETLHKNNCSFVTVTFRMPYTESNDFKYKIKILWNKIDSFKCSFLWTHVEKEDLKCCNIKKTRMSSYPLEVKWLRCIIWRGPVFICTSFFVINRKEQNKLVNEKDSHCKGLRWTLHLATV